MKRLVPIPLIAALFVAVLAAPSSGQSADAADVHTFIARNAMLLKRASAIVEKTGNPRARDLLETAINLHRQSQALLDKGSVPEAGRVAMRVRRIIQQTIAVARGDGRLEEEIGRTQRVLERLSQMHGALPPPLAHLADQAAEMQSRARQSAEHGDADMAIEQTRGARDLAMRALRAAGPPGESPVASARRAVSLTDEILDGARSVVEDSPDPDLARRIEQTARQQEDARRALDAGDSGRAMHLTMDARESLRAALRAAAGPVDPAIVETALKRTDEVIARLRKALDHHDDADARDLLQRATARQEQARRALGDGQPRRALVLSKVAFHFARTALDRVGGGPD